MDGCIGDSLFGRGYCIRMYGYICALYLRCAMRYSGFGPLCTAMFQLLSSGSIVRVCSLILFCWGAHFASHCWPQPYHFPTFATSKWTDIKTENKKIPGRSYFVPSSTSGWLNAIWLEAAGRWSALAGCIKSPGWPVFGQLVCVVCGLEGACGLCTPMQLPP